MQQKEDREGADFVRLANRLRMSPAILMQELRRAFWSHIRERDPVSAVLYWAIVGENIRGTYERLYGAIDTTLMPLLNDSRVYSVSPDLLFADVGVRQPAIELVRSVSDRLAMAIAKNPKLLYEIGSRRFEELMADVVAQFGFDVELTAQTRDGGRDIIAIGKGDIGRSRLLIEAKRYAPDRPVGIELVRALYGVKTDERATKALLATTSRFTQPAREFEERHLWEMELKDYEAVLEWITKFRKSKGLD
jgi:HJR/Mrr/RecB family endonuclease